jgi:hypothetical protein
MRNFKTCPKCDGYIPNNLTPGAYPGALSRVDNETEICSECGILEAINDYTNLNNTPNARI